MEILNYIRVFTDESFACELEVFRLINHVIIDITTEREVTKNYI